MASLSNGRIAGDYDIPRQSAAYQVFRARVATTEDARRWPEY